MTNRRRGRFLTPSTPPDALLCRAFSIPNNAEWLGNFMGALYELVEENNWEQFGSLTPEETAEAYAAIINVVLPGSLGECATCVLPGGSPLFRIASNGRIQQLVGDEWEDPQGEYTLPPTPPRSEPTPDERKCLAAANAAAVFEQIYEEISDAYNEGLTLQQWTEFLVGLLITILGTIFGLVIAPLVLIGVLIVTVIYETLEFVGADLWTEEFTDKLQCLLYECANDDGDVVHFDWTCVQEKLANNVDLFDPTISEIRLFGQLTFIMAILGSQALDAMGATTGVETADCSLCDSGWSKLWDFRIDPYQFSILDFQGEWIDGVGFNSTFLTSGDIGFRDVVAVTDDFTTLLTGLKLVYEFTAGVLEAGAGNVSLALQDRTFTRTYFQWLLPESPPASPQCWVATGAPEENPTLQISSITGFTTDASDPGGTATIISLYARGLGTPPPGGVDIEWDDCE